jgi:RHS repeat-associated protein
MKTNSMNINVMRFAAVVAATFSLCAGEAFAERNMFRNMPSKCNSGDKQCGCSEQKAGDKIKNDCIKVYVGLGESTPWTGSINCSLKIFADNDSPLIFTADSLYAVLGGYTFKRLGTQNLADGTTPAEVVLSHENGEPIHFVFKDGESMARPDPGVHIKMDERLQMVDAEGWATTHDPVYYDLYVGDGTKRRFLATDMTGALGSLVSITDARGVTVTSAEMGVDIVYDSNGVRQFLTPSSLADVVQHPGFTGYDVKVYAIDEVPVKNAATGLYAPPNAAPVKVLTVRRENDGKRAVVTVKRGGNDPLRYVFDYVFDDWSLTHPSGVIERKERMIDDERSAQLLEGTYSASGIRLSRSEYNYKWEFWGFAMTNRVEGFDGLTNITTWTYYTSGNGKGQVKTEKRQSGLLIQYVYDNVDRVISETRSGPGMMTEVTTYDYTPVDASDPVLPVDNRPRTVVRKLNNIECERTYYVYSPLTNIVERVGTQGAAFGGTNVLRTVTAFYPAVANDVRSGLVSSIRHEDGKLDVYDYALTSNLWVETVTHLHEQSPSPVSGKTTRDITLTNARGENIEQKTEAFIDGIWYTISRNRMTYNSQGKRTSVENLAGQVTTTAWDCCHKVSETGPDGSTTTWDYDVDGRVIASSRLIPLDMTNVTWLTTCYRYDALGRQVAAWQTNYAAQVGLPATRTRYDALGRVIARVDTLGNTTTTEYSPDGRTVFVRNPNSSTVTTTRSASGDVLSITGTAVTPEFHSYGILPDGTRWTKTIQGETASSPRFTKRYENLLGKTIREERSGFQGAVLSTVHTYDSFGRLVSTSADYEPTVEYTYDVLGNRVATTKTVGGDDPGAPQSADTQWRKSESLSHIAIIDGSIWLTQTNIVSCSDSSIAPFVTSSLRQLTGLTAALSARSRSFDVRGNVTENETLFDSAFAVSRQTLPYATNKPLSLSRYGVSLMDVSVSAVTNTIAYDSLGRQIATTDGRGNTRQTEYNSLGQRSASIDALGNRTTYSYDQFSNLASVTDPLGNATIYEYNLRGNKVLEYGATYPVRYTYDIFGNKTSMTTFRDAGGPTSVSAAGDVTTWLYDIASGAMTNKVYADGKGPTYSYTPDGKLSRRTWARGIVTDYSYDNWGNLTNTVYSDGTPTIALSYDALGRQTEAHDAAGITTFIYDSFGSITNETVIGVAGTTTIIRHWDSYGRSLGYSLVGLAVPNEPHRQSTLAYDPATGRLASMHIPSEQSNNPNNQTIKQFSWNYLPGSDLKSSLAYPNGLTASWTYDANNQLLQVCNAFPTNVISQYDYTYDAAGRRVACGKSGSAFAQNDIVDYGYNNRSELTNAVAAIDADYRYSYAFDDIGNRETSSERGTNSVYTANQLNQYTEISSSALSASPRETFTPTYDDDGNQTLIKTATGVWQVAYNGENRPVLWTLINSSTPNSSTPPLISMSYDRMDRRVAKNNQRFVYDGYLQIANFEHQTLNIKHQTFIWDPTEKIATRPLVWNSSTIQPFNFSTSYYVHDGNKNVSEVVDTPRAVVAHYGYAPFGAVTFSQGDFAFANPWRFSSEYADTDLGLVYYNYRHYVSMEGRWMSRDPIGELSSPNLYELLTNNSIGGSDYRGLFKTWHECDSAKNSIWNNTLKKEFQEDSVNGCNIPDIRCECCKTKSRRGRTKATNDRGTKSEIVICVEVHKSEEDVRKTVLHELEHAKDHCKWGVKKFNCNQAICSELWAWKLHGCEHLRGDARRECSREGVKSSLKKKPACRGVQNLDERITQLFNACYDR